ncbi:MAG: molybdenum cofactor biosynthesis protein MoaE [Oligoflexia bacterium]|nr:molybdenum cofactor biosynthesis protein MoaE [Oligoflexia bacterium]
MTKVIWLCCRQCAEVEMGNIFVKVTSDPVCLSEILIFNAGTNHGAMNCFIGIVRNNNWGRKVIGMEYDCFIPLCEKTFFEIATEAKGKWCKDANIFVVHRYGKLKVGDTSVAIIATTEHRNESYCITRYIIEEIKVRSPIWKKEFYEDGETGWVRGHALCQHRKVDYHEHGGSYTCGGEVHPHETR